MCLSHRRKAPAYQNNAYLVLGSRKNGSFLSSGAGSSGGVDTATSSLSPTAARNALGEALALASTHFPMEYRVEDIVSRASRLHGTP